MLVGGNRHSLGGTFFEPTVIANATPKMRVTREEIFGPVSPVYRFSTEEEVVSLSNDTNYGLACYFYTSDLGQAFRVMEELEFGLVGLNEGVISTPEAPFGGYKESGVGTEGGRTGIDEYLNTKYVGQKRFSLEGGETLIPLLDDLIQHSGFKTQPGFNLATHRQRARAAEEVAMGPLAVERHAFFPLIAGLHGEKAELRLAQVEKQLSLRLGGCNLDDTPVA